MTERIWSPYQQAIFDELISGTSSLCIHAVAGSGKTTTLVEMAKRVPRGKFAIVLAFNKAIADELQTKLPYYVQSRTFHSYAFDALKQIGPKPPRVTFKKVGNIFKEIAGSDKVFFKHVGALTKLIGYAKASGLGLPTVSEATDVSRWEELIEYYDVETGNVAELIHFAQATLKANNEDVANVDFDDMLYLPLLRNTPFQLADYVFVDEAQDLNTVQHLLLLRMLKQPTANCSSYNGFAAPHEDIDTCCICGAKKADHVGGRLIAVGDPHQSIYGFRGADVDGMEKLKKSFNATELPLSVSYRCSQAVVAEANRVLQIK